MQQRRGVARRAALKKVNMSRAVARRVQQQLLSGGVGGVRRRGGARLVTFLRSLSVSHRPQEQAQRLCARRPRVAARGAAAAAAGRSAHAGAVAPPACASPSPAHAATAMGDDSLYLTDERVRGRRSGARAQQRTDRGMRCVRSQYVGQRRLRGVHDVVPFCYGTVAWFIGKKARHGASQRQRHARRGRTDGTRTLAHAERAGRALAPLDRLPAQRERRGPDARDLKGARATRCAHPLRTRKRRMP